MQKKNAYKSKTLTGKTIHVSVINILWYSLFFMFIISLTVWPKICKIWHVFLGYPK